MKDKLTEIDTMLLEIHTYLNQLLLKANGTEMPDDEFEKLEGIEETMEKARQAIADMKESI